MAEKKLIPIGYRAFAAKSFYADRWIKKIIFLSPYNTKNA